MNNKYAESDTRKIDMLNRYFASQMNINDETQPLSQLPPAEHHLYLASIVITAEDVTDSLRISI